MIGAPTPRRRARDALCTAHSSKQHGSGRAGSSTIEVWLPVSAAGNYVNFNSWTVGSPGTGWNVLTVGGIDDRSTLATSDDRMWYVPGSNGSNYADPPGTAWNRDGDFNKPDVAAPAADAPTTPLTVPRHKTPAAPAAVTDILRLLRTMRLLGGE